MAKFRFSGHGEMRVLTVKPGRKERICESERDYLADRIINGFLPLRRSRQSGSLVYYTMDFVSLKDYLEHTVLGRSTFLRIAGHILETVGSCRDQNLDYRNIVLRPDRIFVNPKTALVRVIYLPFVHYEQPETLKQLFFSLALNGSFSPYESTEYVKDYLRYLNEHEVFSIVDLKDYLQEQKNGKTSVQAGGCGRTEESRQPNGPPQTDCPTVLLEADKTTLLEKMWGNEENAEEHLAEHISLIRILTGERILVDHVPFYLGTDLRTADYVIGGSRGVSRRHARITCSQGKCRLSDLHSTNGTLLNGRQLIPQEDTALANGDQLSLAGEIFEFLQEKNEV